MSGTRRQDASGKADAGHWSVQKEAASSDRPMQFLIALVHCLPFPLLACMVIPVSFFYYLFVRKARQEAVRYQKQLIAFYKRVRAKGLDFITAKHGLAAMKYIDLFIEKQENNS